MGGFMVLESLISLKKGDYMVKAIPKFLHKTLKNTIGKLSNKISANHIMTTKIRFEKNWSERHTVYRTIDYKSTTTESVLSLLENYTQMPHGYEVDDIIEMLKDGRHDEAYDIIESAIEEHHDYWYDEADCHGEEVDHEDHDSEYQDTLDSDLETDVVLSEQSQEVQQIVHNLREQARGPSQQEMEGSQRWERNMFSHPTFGRNSWLNWLFGRRITPFNNHIQNLYLERVEELAGDPEEARQLREHLGEIDGS